MPAHGGEEVTVVRVVGNTTRHPDELLATRREPSKTARARQVLLQILAEADGRTMPSEELDELVATHADVAPRTVQNLRKSLGREGLVRAEAERIDGQAKRWFVVLTEAGLLASEAAEEAPAPDTLSKASRASRASGPPDALDALDAQEAPSTNEAYLGTLTENEREVIDAIGEKFGAPLVPTTADDLATINAIQPEISHGEIGPARDEPDEALTASGEPPVSALFDTDEYQKEKD